MTIFKAQSRRQGDHRSFAAIASLALAAASLGGCSGGGTPGPAASASSAQLLSIALEPGGEIWNWNSGAPITTALNDAKLNARLVFSCDGAVAVGAPGSGSALISGLPSGVYSTEDDPALPFGNRRRLVFTPNVFYSAAPSACASGFAAGNGYSIEVPLGRFGIGGLPLANAATGVTFTAAQCGAGAFADPVAGAPFITDSFPPAYPAGGSPILALPPESILQNQVTLAFNEPLDLSSVSGGLQVRDVVTGTFLPGTSSVVFDQVSIRSVLRYTAVSKLPGARTLEILIPAGITDYAGNAFVGDSLFFTTAASTAPADTFVESFDTTALRGTASVGADWAGTGSVVFGDLTGVVGDGSDGPGVFTGGVNPLDTDGQIVVGGVPQSRRGVFNYSSLSVAAGATVRIHGPYPAHLRINGAATIDGVIRADAGSILSGTPGVPSYEYGPRGGVLDNGVSIGLPTVPGGRGNGGGGDGGRASHADTFSAPTGYCPPGVLGLHNYFGESGTGPYVDGVASTVPGTGGGRGGRSGFIPQTFAGEIGGYGGAGGTAATVGATGQPRVTFGCSPANTVICPLANGGDGLPLVLAAASAVSPAFIPPISFSTAGSGGGAGGDKLQSTVGAPAQDDQGGGGGGGGGAIRLSVAGPSVFGATAILSANGAAGGFGASAQFAGNGGSGSGGQIWVEGLGGLTIPQTTQWSVFGPDRVGTANATACTTSASGSGGQGLIQIETPINVAPPVITTVSLGAVVQTTSTLPISSGGLITGVATSRFFDSGRFAPDWLSAVEVASVGSLSGATITVRYEGAHVLPDGSGPDVSTLRSTTNGQPGGPPITATDLSALDGFRYVRFSATGSAPFTIGSISNVPLLPRLESITLTVGG